MRYRKNKIKYCRIPSREFQRVEESLFLNSIPSEEWTKDRQQFVGCFVSGSSAFDGGFIGSTVG
jgi:hypothetical protein